MSDLLTDSKIRLLARHFYPNADQQDLDKIKYKINNKIKNKFADNKINNFNKLENNKLVENKINYMEILNQKDEMYDYNIEPKKLVTKKAHIFLDSKYRIRNGNTNYYTWKLANPGDLYDNNTAYSSSKINNIISIKLFPFLFPNSKLSVNDSVLVCIKEAESQAYVLNNGKRFHFEYYMKYTLQQNEFLATGDRQTVDELLINYVPNVSYFNYTQITCDELGKNKSVFKFDKPVKQFNDITLNFIANEKDIVFDQDTISAILYPRLSELSKKTIIEFDTNPYITSFDEITITINIPNQNDPAFRKLSQDLNNTFTVRDIEYISTATDYFDNHFIMVINYDSSLLFTLPSPQYRIPCSVFLESKRIAMRMEIEYLSIS
jgi:hypothetical protein